MRRRACLALLVGTAAAAGGCGFRLQGRETLPESLRTLRVDADERQSDFVLSLREGLQRAGARLVPEGTAGVARVRVLRDEIIERVLTVSSRNIPTDYELTHELRFAVDGPDGKELLPPEDLSLTRIYSFDERRLLAKEREKDLLVAALARDMASVVLRRLASL